jgi:hypothetical protein
MQASQSAPEAAFRAGYRDYGGNPAWEEHLVTDVILECENRGRGWFWDWTLGDFYWSVAQFHPDSWARAAALSGLGDPTNPYHVGANVAWWSNAIEHPGGTGGWATCWWQGDVP